MFHLQQNKWIILNIQWKTFLWGEKVDMEKWLSAEGSSVVFGIIWPVSLGSERGFLSWRILLELFQIKLFMFLFTYFIQLRSYDK